MPRTTSSTRRALALAAALAVLGLPAVVSAPAAQAANPYDVEMQDGILIPSAANQSRTQTFTVPVGVCSGAMTLRGATGGVAQGGRAGVGAALTAASVPLTGGDQFTVTTGGAGLGSTEAAPRGGQGAAGMDGGNGEAGGGGASRILNTTTGAVVAVAAGGGGGGEDAAGGAGGAATAGVDHQSASGSRGAAGTSSAGGAGGAASGMTTGGSGAASVGGSVALGGGGGGGGVFGGGAGAGATGRGGGGGGGYSALPGGWTDVRSGTSTLAVATGYFNLVYAECPSPVVATGLSVSPTGSTTASLTFTPGAPTGMPVDGWQVSTDGGSSWQALTVAGGATRNATLTGLTQGSTYQVQVRPVFTHPAIKANGLVASADQGPATSSVPLTMPVPPGPVSAVTATAGVSSVAVSWTAPTSGGAPTGYTVTASPGQAICTTTTTSCVLGGVAGTAYTVSVVANGAGGTVATAGTATSGPVTAPPVPTGVPIGIPTMLTTTDGQIDKAEPGQDITVVGTGFAPFSEATVVIYSTPTVLGTVTTDVNGSFRKQVRVPASLVAGQHTLVASGTDPSGNQRYLALPVSVAPSTGGPTATVSASPSTGGPTATGPVLASTGAAVGLPLAVGALALLGGTGLLLLGRRRAHG